MRATLHKSERLSGLTALSTLMSKGRWAAVQGLKYCFLSPNGTPDGKNRIAVSVPKRLFKRAVKRNLLKRRIREAYRTRKWLLYGDAQAASENRVCGNSTLACSTTAVHGKDGRSSPGAEHGCNAAGGNEPFNAVRETGDMACRTDAPASANRAGGTDILFVYNTKEVLDYQSICAAVEAILRRIGQPRSGLSSGAGTSVRGTGKI